jgi:tripartite-type tricarboxylate transporter receptor subunit TctC
MVCVLFCAGLSPPAARAQTVAEFYRANPITVFVASDVGGAYDVYTRTVTRFYSKHIPGQPTMIVKFMPGAGGLIAVNHLANVAARDGSAIGAIRAANPVEPLLNPGRQVQFDPRELNWLGNVSSQHGTCFTWHTSPVRTLDQAKSREVTVAATSSVANVGTLPQILNVLIGTKFKLVAGYSTGGMRLALERGETDGICGLSFATLMAAQGDWIAQKKINFLAQTGLEKNPALPDVPLVSDYAKDAADRMIFHMLDYREILGRPYVAPPGVPAARLAALRQAFDETMRDPEFIAEAQRLGMTVEPTDHKGMEKIIADAYAIPKDIIEKTFALMRGIGMGSGEEK